MGTSSGLAFTSEEELKRSEMIIVTFVSVVLLISGSIAQFQGGKCPNTPDCVLNGGKCFPKRCPSGFEKIGPCLRTGCVCCKPILGVGQCPKDPSCEAKRGVCQFPKCEKGFMEIGICRQGLPPFACKCCTPFRRG